MSPGDRQRPNSGEQSLEDPRLVRALEEYLAALEAGQRPDRRAFLARHAEVAPALAECLDGLEVLHQPRSRLEYHSNGCASTLVDEVGQSALLGDFRIVREIGRGGMGVVYLAEQVSLHRSVALKVLPLAATMDPRQLERFRHEARAAGLLHHQHIVPVYGVGCERGVHYYAMRLIEGCSLAAVIEGRRREPAGVGHWALGISHGASASASTNAQCRIPNAFGPGTVPSRRTEQPFRRVAELVAQVADALEYAHAMGVVHRDVKPANLLLDAGGNVWVTDFGLARLGESSGLTISGDLLGTLRYMSPEQAWARHGLVDHRTDVYSLGATLYELLTLRPAVDGTSKQEILHRLTFEEPISPRKIDRSIPAELETVTLKAMARNVPERYATAGELADDLRRWLADRPILARPPGPWQRLRKWSLRHRPLVVALGAFLVLLVAGLCLGTVAYGVRKGELADERSRLAQEKEQSQRKIAEELRQVLVQRADAVRLARRPGYRRHVWADLRRAINLPKSGEDRDRIRAIVLGCLGDAVGLGPVPDLTGVPRLPLSGQAVATEPWAREAAGGRKSAVSPDGNLVAVAGRAGRVTVYSRKGNQLREEKCPLGGVYDLAVAEDGKVLVAGCEQGFVAWELPGPQRWAVRAGNVFSVAISPNHRLLASSGRQLELWSLVTKRLLASWPAPAAGAHLEFSGDGRTLLAVANGNPVAGWPVSDTPERRVFDGHRGGVAALAFSPDGRRLISGSKDRTVRLWSSASGRLLRTLTGHPGEVEAVALDPSGSLLATGDLTGRLRVWDARSGDLLVEPADRERSEQVWRLQFAPGGEYLAAAGGALVTWTVHRHADRVALERLCTLVTTPRHLGTIDLAARPGSPELFFLNRGGQLCCHDLSRADDPQVLAKARAGLRGLHVTPGGDLLTFITPGGTLGLWDPRRKEARDTRCRADTVAVSADGLWAAVAQAGRSIAIVELPLGREVLALPAEGSDVWCLAWAPDGGRLAAGLSDGTVAVWDLEQVRARLADFGLASPSTVRRRGPRPAGVVPALERVVRVNRLRQGAEKARRMATQALEAGKHAAARDHLLEILDLDGRLVEIAPDAAGHRKRLAWAHGELARVLVPLGDPAGALRHREKEVSVLQRLVADEPRKALSRERLVSAYHSLGFQLAQAGRRAEAPRWYLAALAAGDRLVADFPAVADAPWFWATRGATLLNLGIHRALAGARSEARELFRKAVPLRLRLADEFPTNPTYAINLARLFAWQGTVLRDLGKIEDSAKVFREAVRRQGAALGLRPGDPVFRELGSHCRIQLADVLVRLDKHADAAAAIREVPRLTPDDPARLFTAARLLARCVAPAERDKALPGAARSALAQTYRREAVSMAQKAVARGLTNAARLLADPDFDAVRGCDEFRQLLARVTPQKKQ
jgi:serine/threonine protein kinase/WD40 repeat protein/tetratricopeptide (TPR) repeat protein